MWQETLEGRKPQMVRTAYGAVEWIKEQKGWLAEQMEQKYQWKRLYKGKNECGDLLLSDYRRERAAEKAKETELEMERQETELMQIKETAEKTMQEIEEKIGEKKVDLLVKEYLVRKEQENLQEVISKKEIAQICEINGDTAHALVTI